MCVCVCEKPKILVFPSNYFGFHVLFPFFFLSYLFFGLLVVGLFLCYFWGVEVVGSFLWVFFVGFLIVIFSTIVYVCYCCVPVCFVCF